MKAVAFLSICALALAAPAAEPESEAADLPLSRRKYESITRDDGTVDVENLLASLQYTMRKYRPDAQLGQALQGVDLDILKRGNVQLTDAVEDGEDEEYYGPGSVRNQGFLFDFDTGSSDTFVPGPKCGKAQGCSGTVRYDQKGIDRKTTTTVTYGSGQVSGEDYFDTVTVGGKTATKQNIISLTKASGFNGTGSNSLMGMGFQSIASSKQTPFFFNLIQQGKCAAREFAFFLGRKKSGTAALSQMTICGRNPAKYSGAITKVPVTKQGYWQVAIQGATVTGGLLGLPSLPTTAGQAAIDTGTTLIIAPTVAATSIFAQIPGSIPIPQGGVPPILVFAYPCNSRAQVSLSFAGKQFAVNPLDFNFGRLTGGGASILAAGDEGLLGKLLSPLAGGMCIAGIAGADLEPTEELYIVGDVFLKNWYSVFHYDSPSSAYVGFAKATANQ